MEKTFAEQNFKYEDLAVDKCDTKNVYFLKHSWICCICAFSMTGQYQDILDLETNFAYKFYQTHGRDRFYQEFKDEYSNSGYTQFIGRTINELGMVIISLHYF